LPRSQSFGAKGEHITKMKTSERHRVNLNELRLAKLPFIASEVLEVVLYLDTLLLKLCHHHMAASHLYHL